MLVTIKRDYNGKLLDFSVGDGPEPDMDEFYRLMVDEFFRRQEIQSTSEGTRMI